MNNQSSHSDNITPSDNSDDLDAFSQEFFGGSPEVSETEYTETETSVPEVNETEETPVDGVVEEENVSTETEEVGEEDEETDGSEEDVSEDKSLFKTRKNKKSFQERINELTHKAREAERQKDELENRLRELEEKVSKPQEKAEDVPPTLVDVNAPNPDSKDAEGNLLYPLGEYDPAFIRDFTRYTIKLETEQAKAEAAKAAEQEVKAQAQVQLQTEWVQKLNETEQEIPDLREKIATLEDQFTGVDPAYGEYLVSVIMASEVGPKVLYHLSENPGEAQKIVASGATAATLAIGRLEAKFLYEQEAKEQASNKPKKKVTSAPTPPPTRTRGAGASNTIPDDTDDLEAFEAKFFNRK